MQNPSVSGLRFRPAVSADQSSVAGLNSRWVNAFHEGSISKGFLRHAFTNVQVAQLIEAREVVVAQTNSGEIVGYYLTNGIIHDEEIARRRRLVACLIAGGQLPEGRYVYLAQAAISETYMGRGVARRLLTELKILVNDRYDFLIGYIDAANESARIAHGRSGWNVFTEFGDGHLAVTSTHQQSCAGAEAWSGSANSTP